MTPPALHMETRGEGEPVICLHSGGMAGRQWYRLADELSPTHKMILPDLTGSGANPALTPGEAFEFHVDVDAVLALMAAEAQPVHLIGHSYGGLIALTAARTRPQQVRSVAVFDPVVMGVLYDAGDREGLADLQRYFDARDAIDTAAVGFTPWMAMFVDYWMGQGAWAALPGTTRAAYERVAYTVFREAESLLRDRTPRAAYQAIVAPVLVLSGTNSPAGARRAAALLASALPSGEARAIDGAGHMGPITHARIVNAAIAAHLRPEL